MEDAGCLERGHSRSASVRVGRTSLMNYGFLFLFTILDVISTSSFYPGSDFLFNIFLFTRLFISNRYFV